MESGKRIEDGGGRTRAESKGSRQGRFTAIRSPHGRSAGVKHLCSLLHEAITRIEDAHGKVLGEGHEHVRCERREERCACQHRRRWKA